MSLSNTAATYGTISKTFHWLTALLIFTALPLGIIANDMGYETSAELARKAQLFSLHKTVGVTVFFVALARILWALSETRPKPLHPERKAETLLAEVVHWALYGALVMVPASGWIHHAASEGFAPILWPFGQSLPLVPKDETVMAVFGAIHGVFTKILIGAIVLHIAGALKHALIDRDATLSRMLPGRAKSAPPTGGGGGHALPAALAAGVYAVGAAIALILTDPSDAAQRPSAPVLADSQGGWAVQDGTLAITVSQFGSDVTGSFADWSASIDFAETPTDGSHGSVSVDVSIPSLTLGSVTSEAMGPDYFDAETHPTANYTAVIRTADTGYVADGTLTLKGAEVPVTLPFTLDIDGDTATMSGATTLDRRDYAIGAGQTDEGTLGFAVSLAVDLTAVRQ
ncbi:cytochrome b/b6 domain-containing protein [Oceaniglobus indicus]|uniref:cytochrome b/b6 domain-containing protein n=1 Tax=Oceaniglobus indicus TaxID=2047749 RepID=UPI000C1A8564|nr:cytochrome b/b6 domain-containing protein [Oceaniglobus indicus]